MNTLNKINYTIKNNNTIQHLYNKINIIVVHTEIDFHSVRVILDD